jgi:hypothetical protein
MTVRELIELLQDCDENKIVTLDGAPLGEVVELVFTNEVILTRGE